ncbi:hypothetical protein TIFTF001_028503 [Ficus carica]|uniref:DUF1985 domain-containing protein n=1 Tax=Ficus carica TaxID=3494 RepID=A0AA88IWM7_FICCA|nr:hypothetical protein TIFTF001_028503 [Ficus carica]
MLGWAGQVFHNIVMRLTDHLEMGDALWFEVGEDLGRFSINELCLITGMKYLSNAKFDNDDDAVKLGLLYMIFCIPLANANSVKVDPKYFVLAKNLEEFNAFPWGVLSCKFTTKYVEAIPRILLWTSTDNVKFDDVMSALTTVDEKQPKYIVMMPTDEDLKDPCVAQLYLKNPTVVPQPPRKTPVTQPSTETNSEWREFQKEIRGYGNLTTAYHVSSKHKRSVQTDYLDALKTDFDDL